MKWRAKSQNPISFPQQRLVTAAVPSKLMLCGEYAILQPGGNAVALAVQPEFHVSCGPSSTFTISLPDLGLEATLPDLSFPPARSLLNPLLFPLSALDMLRRHLYSLAHPALSILESGVRISAVVPASHSISAALCAGTILSASSFLGVALSPYEAFRLAAQAHSRVQEGGSGYDVATVILRGAVRFRNAHSGGLEILGNRKNGIPAISLAVASTGKHSPTAEMLRRFRSALASPRFRLALKQHQRSSAILSAALWEPVWSQTIPDAVEQANGTLKTLDAIGNIGIITPEISVLLDTARQLTIPARVSGAGGGDLVVGLCSCRGDALRLATAWSDAGFEASIPIVASFSDCHSENC